jgi:hypothetical protein
MSDRLAEFYSQLERRDSPRTVPIHSQITPLEAVQMFSWATKRLSPKENALLKEAVTAANGPLHRILSLYIPSDAFQFGKFSVPEGIATQSYLYGIRLYCDGPDDDDTDNDDDAALRYRRYDEGDDGDEADNAAFAAAAAAAAANGRKSRGQLASPKNVQLNGLQIQQLLTIFIHLAHCNNLDLYVNHSHDNARYDRAYTKANKLAKQVASYEGEEWHEAFQLGWSPLLIEECMDDDGHKTVGYRFWLFLHRSRQVDLELDQLIRWITAREKEHGRAMSQIRTPPKSKNKKRNDDGPNANANPNELPPAAAAAAMGPAALPAPLLAPQEDTIIPAEALPSYLMRGWEAQLYELVNPVALPGVATSRVAGIDRLYYAMTRYLEKGDLIDLPAKFRHNKTLARFAERPTINMVDEVLLGIQKFNIRDSIVDSDDDDDDHDDDDDDYYDRLDGMHVDGDGDDDDEGARHRHRRRSHRHARHRRDASTATLFGYETTYYLVRSDKQFFSFNVDGPYNRGGVRTLSRAIPLQSSYSKIPQNNNNKQARESVWRGESVGLPVSSSSFLPFCLFDRRRMPTAATITTTTTTTILAAAESEEAKESTTPEPGSAAAPLPTMTETLVNCTTSSRRWLPLARGTRPRLPTANAIHCATLAATTRPNCCATTFTRCWSTKSFSCRTSATIACRMVP